MSKKISISIILAALICVNLQANETSEITVTSATNSEQSIKDITSTVEIITGAQLSERHMDTIIDVLKNIAGIPMAQSGGIGQQSSFFTRGMSGGNILVLIDGIKYNDPTSTEGQAQLEHLMVNDIDRIEIIKGAQSGIWGADAVAGVINIITKKPTEKLTLNASIEAGSYNTQKYSASVSQKVDKLSYYLGANYLKSDGISAQTPKGTNPDNFEKDGYENKTFNAKLGYDITENDKLNFNITDIDAKVKYDSWGNPNDSIPEVTQNNIVYGVGYKHKFNSIANVQMDYEKGEFTKKDPSGFTKEFKGENSKISAKSKINYAKDAFAVFGYDNAENKDKTTSHKIDSSAIFITNSNKAGKLIVTESLRSDFYNTFDDKVTGKVGAKYNFTTELSAYANYGTGYKTPSIYQLYTPVYGNPHLNPESSVSRDISLEYKHLKVTYFETEVTDLIGFDPVTYVNEQVDGKSKFRGYELKYSNTIASNLLLDVSYNILSAKNQYGQDLQRRPDRSANASLDYYGIDRLHLGLNSNYIGTRYDDLAKTKQTGRYVLFGCVTNYELSKKTKIYAKIDNMLDKRYQEVDGYGTYGRTIFIGLNSSF
jgi:vitamin B12 transporter